MAAHITILGFKMYCPNCDRDTWHHRRCRGHDVCRGDLLPSKQQTPPPNIDLGCGFERGVTYGRTDRR